MGDRDVPAPAPARTSRRRVATAGDVDFAKGGGLVPVVVQDVATREVLTVAFMNEEALAKTLATGLMHYWSRSRGSLWKKGETSGHFQHLKSLSLDCDDDAILALVEQEGVACHKGTFTCFEKDIHGAKEGSPLVELWETILARREADASESYTAKLYSDPNLMLKKVAEEASEVIMAYKDGKREEMVHELVDLMYHGMVVAGKAGITPAEILAEVRKRRK